jgi:hypothetical protein
MTRFFGKVGFATEVREYGITRTVITERTLKGEVKRSSRYFRTGDSVLGEVSQQTRIEVMADTYALENYEAIRYVVRGGTAWEVDSSEPERPRLILVLGGRYTGPRPEEETPNG